MAKKIIKAHMKQRRDTKANWASVNPVLLDGELGIVSDDPNLYKVGDGATAWNDLPFRGYDGTLAQELGSSPNAVISQQVVSNEIETLQNDLRWTQDEQRRIESETKAGLQDLQKTTQKKADQDGKYPELTAGFANNLVGRGEAVDATINFRPSGGTSIEDGAARVKELKGNSLVWNQLTRNPQFNTWDGWSVDGTRVSADGVAIITASSSVTGVFQTISKAMANHIYFLSANVKTSVATSVYVYLGTNIHNGLRGDTDGSTFTNISGIFSNINMTSPTYQCSAYIAAGETMSIKDMIFIDLTQMFGAGNEPTTIEEFYNRIPQNVDLYAYNEGEVISTNAEGVKSVGFNAWDEEWEQGMYATGREGKTILATSTTSRIRNANPIEVLPNTTYSLTSGSGPLIILCCDKDNVILSEAGKSSGTTFTTPQNCKYVYFYVYDTAANATYKNDICINLAHSDYRNGEYQPYMQFIRDIDSRIKEAFPNGLRSAGNASDKVYNKNGKGIIEKRIGSVDLGTLSWEKGYEDVFGATTFSSSVNGRAKSMNVLTSKYPIHGRGDSNKGIFSFPDGTLTITDADYTDAATFKAAMSGVMLYYELAEPEILEFDEPFNLDYEVWDFGTEQMIATEPSAPIKANIVYGFNAVDSVRTAQLEIAELKTQIAQMQIAMASMAAQPAMIKE